MLRSSQVPESVLSQIHKHSAVWKEITHEGGCRLGQERLLAMPEATKSGAPIDGGAVVVAVSERSLARVDADADPDRPGREPGLGSQRALDRQRGGDRVRCRAEHGENAV